MGYPKEVYDKGWSVLEERRQVRGYNLERNWEEIRSKVPEISKIQSEMAETAARITKTIINTPEDPKQYIEELARKSLKLQERRKELLLENGYPADFLKGKFYCEKCSDTGYIKTKRCSCFTKLLKQQAFSELSQVANNEDVNFDNFDINYYSEFPDEDNVIPRERMKDVLDFSKKYARDFSKASQNLLFMGKTGLGKTHISLSIAWEVINKGFGVVYTPIQRLMDKLEAKKFSYAQESKEEYSSTMDSIMECDLLVLDDLGTEFITSFTTSVLYSVVNSRLAEGKATIINTNLELVELERIYSQRMASRLGFGYKVVRFYGDDVRFIKRQSRFRQE